MSLHPLVLALAEHQARQSQVNRYAAYSRLALMFYDMFLNIGREKRLVWDSKFRASSVVYLCVRYPLVAFQVFQVSWTTSTPHCDTIEQATWGIALIPTRVAICISFVLRVYAVTGGGKFFAGILTLISLLIIGLDIWQDTAASCTEAQNPLSTVLTFISLIVFDVIATVVISWRLLRAIRESGGFAKLTGQNMVGLVMRSGVLYFNVMTGIQLGAVVLYFLPQGTYSSVLNNYTLLLSSILTARFLLDLRAMAEAEADPPVPTKNQNLQSMKFGANPNPSDSGFESGELDSMFDDRDRRGRRGAWGGAGLVRDFEDNILAKDWRDDVDEEIRRRRETQSMAWPMEDLADRARRTEERLAEEGGVEVR